MRILTDNPMLPYSGRIDWRDKKVPQYGGIRGESGKKYPVSVIENSGGCVWI